MAENKFLQIMEKGANHPINMAELKDKLTLDFQGFPETNEEVLCYFGRLLKK
jgi:hypothetical protein